MTKKSIVLCGLLGLLIQLNMAAQEKGTISEAISRNTTYFKLSANYELTGEARTLLSKEIAEHQFVGLAELHNSQQLSHFTQALIPLLAEAGFQHMALEMGAYQVKSLNAMAKSGENMTETIKAANVHYGSKLLTISPLVFADRVEDAGFLEAAKNHDLALWGLDQEHLFSYEMQFDSIYARAPQKTAELTELYEQSTKLVRKWNKKQVLKGKFKMGCSLLSNPVIQQFLAKADQGEISSKQIEVMKFSWEVYCQIESGRNSNQLRANYMKKRLDQIIETESANKKQPKVFLKFGSVHLTKGKSPYGVDDLGKHVQELAMENQSGFLNIRHLKRYRNGKDLIGKKGWTNSTNFMKMGKKDEWTLIDLRPLRPLLAEGKLACTQKEAFEINSYDFIVISPDDKTSRKNF